MSMTGRSEKTKSDSRRQDWMKVLACAQWADLSSLARDAELPEDFQILRHPEPGLVMIRARMGGTGKPFNTGEATVVRCTVRNGNGVTGHAYVMGRNGDHALCAARLDAALQEPEHNGRLMERIVEPLRQRADERRRTRQRKVAATKVDFFTLVRGEDD